MATTASTLDDNEVLPMTSVNDGVGDAAVELLKN